MKKTFLRLLAVSYVFVSCEKKVCAVCYTHDNKTWEPRNEEQACGDDQMDAFSKAANKVKTDSTTTGISCDVIE